MNTYDKIVAIKDKAKGPFSQRITSEIIYACEISKANEGAYDKVIQDAVDYLYTEFLRNDSVTKDSALKCESMLLPLSKKAKSYKLYCVSHAHIDMNWMWSFTETVAITLDTFRTILALMDEYPNFTFSQSQTSTYKIVEEYDPSMFEQIRKRVEEGRWEVSASTWVEADKNMPNGESLVRQTLYTKKYFKEKFGLNSDQLLLDFEPDTFGHNLSVPEILTKGNVKYYYHCRGFDAHNIYNWISPSGSTVLAYREPVWYNATVTPDMIEFVPSFCRDNNIDFMLKVYGVGDHGGGPTRKDIETIIDMADWPIAPTIEFGTYHKFFGELGKKKDQFPTIDHELNYVFTGCYSSQSRIKMSNRIAEDSLFAAEAVSAIARNFADGEDYTVNYKTAWEKVLFNQFHDIITGSGVRETREYAMGEIQKTLGFTYTGTSKAMIAIAGQIDTSAIAVDTDLMSTSEGGGVGYRGSNEINSTMIANQTIYAAERGNGNTRIVHIFNPTGFDREETTEITLWDYSGKTDQIAITDSNGESVEFKLVEHNGFWGHEFDKILLFAKVKAFGYNTYIIKQTAKTDFFLTGSLEPRTEKYKKNVLENEFIRAEFDDNNMILKKLIDKRTGNVLINGDSAFFKLVMQSHKSHTVMFGNAWVEGMDTKSVNLNETEQVFVTEQSYDNQLRQHITYSIPFMASLLKVTVILDKNATSLRFKVDCDWQEKFAESTGIPTLKFAVPVAYNVNGYKYESQFGVATREDKNHDVPARSFAYAVNSEAETGVAVFTDSIYGYRGESNAINLTLLRSSQFPDPYPENGQHNYNIGVGVSESENKNLYRQSSAFIHPLINVAGTSHKGEMPLSHSFFTTQGDIVVSTVKTPEDASDGFVIRVFDVSGKGTEGSIIFDRTIKSAQTLDINEDPVSTALNVSDKTVSFRLKPFEIITIKIRT